MKYESKNIRNIVLIGHGYSGKTTLTEAMLFTGQTIPLMGKVENGKTVSDYNEQEIAKKISIRSSICHTQWRNILMNIIDTPGAPDFVGEVIAGINSADCAVFVINGESGVEIETIKSWRKCNLPKIVFVNKMQKENADLEKCIKSLTENFKDKTFIPLSIPIGKGKNFTGVVDLIDKEARIFENQGKTIRKEKASADIPGLKEYYTKMIETAVETDEVLMTNYLDGKEITHEETVKGLKKAILSGSIVPVICGDADENSGTIALLDCIVDYMPSPLEVSPVTAIDADNKEILIEADNKKAPIVFIFKTAIDQFTGKISYFRVRSGTVKNDLELYNPRKKSKEKCGKLFKVLGKTLIDIDSLDVGDIGAFIKLESVLTNDTLCDGSAPVSISPLPLPQPVYKQSIHCNEKKDEEKLIAMLQRASEEDPTFKIEYNPETRENVIMGMGDMQIRLILDKIKEKNKIEAILSDIKIPYRETSKKKANVEYTHKKQSGGHGQYGKVLIEIWPIEEGKQYEFVNGIVGGAISRGYVPACEKGFHEAMEHGVLAGFKVVDVGIRLYDGKEHDVDSSEMSFKIASRGAFREAMKSASPVLLEPVMELSVYVDQKYVGDILSDISSKRGRVLGQESLGGVEVIKALVPQNELLRYSIDLKQMTSGTGGFEVNFSNYQSITGKISDDIIAKSKVEYIDE